jgi:hypothetical protein
MKFHTHELPDAEIARLRIRMQESQQIIVKFARDAFNLSHTEAVHLEWLLHCEITPPCSLVSVPVERPEDDRGATEYGWIA